MDELEKAELAETGNAIVEQLNNDLKKFFEDNQHRSVEFLNSAWFSGLLNHIVAARLAKAAVEVMGPDHEIPPKVVELAGKTILEDMATILEKNTQDFFAAYKGWNKHGKK